MEVGDMRIRFFWWGTEERSTSRLRGGGGGGILPSEVNSVPKMMATDSEDRNRTRKGQPRRQLSL